MKVAVAGTGDVAQYLFEELAKAGHDIVILTRRSKDGRPFEQRETDYSVASLVSVLEDREALISTVSDYSNPSAAAQSHSDMLEAVKQSKTCKTFIPSEWTANIEDHEIPILSDETSAAFHEKLKQTEGIRWTIISNSWFADYIYPASHRHLRDVGPIWPMDWENKIFTIYGPGTQVFNVAAVRDVAKAVAVLLDSKEPWEPYTYISGDQLSWNDMYALVKKRDPSWQAKTKSLADTVNQLIAAESLEGKLLAGFELITYSGASTFSTEKVERQREKYFKGLHFKSVEELLGASEAAGPNQIV